MKCLEKKYSLKEIFKGIFELLLCMSFPITVVWILYTQPINTKELLEPIKSIVNYNLVFKTLSTFFLSCIFATLLSIAFRLEEIVKVLKEKK